MQNFFDNDIEFLKGVGPVRADLIKKELKIFKYGDLIQHYPFRYEDRTKFHQIKDIHSEMPYVQLKGKFRHVEMAGAGHKKRLVAYFSDESGEIELVWFKGVQWVVKRIALGVDYVLYGKPTRFNRKMNIAHPEFELLTNVRSAEAHLQPVYSVTDKLRMKGLDSKGVSKIIRHLVQIAYPHFRETLPAPLISQHKLMPKADAMSQIHFPKNDKLLAVARFRLKYEELFYIQLRLLKMKLTRIDKYKGQIFDQTQLLTSFYNDHLPFDLTNAQKKVIKEIYRDFKSGHQMNRLVQGDVGSGKTIVAFICMLVAIDSGAQVAMMAPTEILAEQHYNGLKTFADKLKLKIALLKGSTKKKERTIIHTMLQSGDLDILIGTHALIEDKVQFKNLGLAVIDEQHRFGVAQRARLWKKNDNYSPHILVMTATPIPRTLAMTLYGDLDVSAIDELPAGRKEIATMHKFDSARIWVFGFIRKQIEAGRQVYIVYPLIEESEKLDLKHLTDGYEAICRAFPEFPVSILHGKMKPDAKDYEMQRFIRNETKIMVATTVIEVGVNVPNATVMIIENAERFGLAQLHQLRGRVGRGAAQSYCILMSDYKLSKESKHRLETMVNTSNGFDIAEADLKLRGPGDLMGTQQSGVLDLLISDIGKDGQILQIARQDASKLLDMDPQLEVPENKVVKTQVAAQGKNVVNWSRIS